MVVAIAKRPEGGTAAPWAAAGMPSPDAATTEPELELKDWVVVKPEVLSAPLGAPPPETPDYHTSMGVLHGLV